MNLPIGIYRIIDANINRSEEALRVLEDISRFLKNNLELTKKIKKIRHNIYEFLKELNIPQDKLIVSRNSDKDVGKLFFPKTEGTRQDIKAIVNANLHRVQESIRVLEEVSKLFDSKVAFKFKKLRYVIYQLEMPFNSDK
ncbi:MAG: thiamine-phosphate pyrophosphorylase [bacterium]